MHPFLSTYAFSNVQILTGASLCSRDVNLLHARENEKYISKFVFPVGNFVKSVLLLLLHIDTVPPK